MLWITVVIWNYFLAIIPFVLSWILYRTIVSQKPLLRSGAGRGSDENEHATWHGLSTQDKISFVVLFMFWFFMFPNIPYLFTGLRHISDVCIPYRSALACNEFPEAIMGILLYVFFGIPLFYLSLEHIRASFESLFNKKLAHVLIVCYLPLCALGVLLGQLDRFNSWDIIHTPLIILITALEYFTTERLFSLFSYTLTLYLIYYFIFLLNRFHRNR